MTEPMTTKAPTARICWQLIRNQPGRYLVNAVLWTSIWVMPVIPALLTRAFFDRIDPAVANTVGFTVPTLIALMLGYGLGRLAIMAIAMWNDVHFMFRTGTQLRRNMLSRVFALVDQRNLYVFNDGQLCDQIIGLKNEPDSLSTNFRKLIVRHFGNVITP